MRLCASCSCEDRPWFEDAACTCGQPEHDDDPSPLKHKDDCHAVGHWVVRYPVRISKSELTFDKQLPRKWRIAGWVLVQNGERYYRVKPLCRNCITLETDAQARRAEYEKLCKAASGAETCTYAQMLASQ